MDVNVGPIDRAMRVVFGLMLLAVPFFGFFTSDWIGQLLAGVAVIVALSLIISGVLARCPLYKTLGINTCPEP